MGIVFTKEEMGTCSITGETSNFQKNKCDLAMEKKQLDPVVRDALISNLFLIKIMNFFQFYF